MKSLKTYIKEEAAEDFEKNIKKLEKTVGKGVSAAGVYECWVFIVARIDGGKNNIRPTPKDIDDARGDSEFHEKGEAWFKKVGWKSGLKDEYDAKKPELTATDNGYQPAWIIDAIQEVGKDVKDIPGISWGSSLNGKIIHKNIGPNYYDHIDKMWKEGESKQNTADMVFITNGSASDLSKSLDNAKEGGTDKITWGPRFKDNIEGRLSNKDKSVQWFQVSLKKGIDDARIGKVSTFLRQKYAAVGFTPKHQELPTTGTRSWGHMPLSDLETNSVIKSRGDFLGVSYGFDDLTDQILLDEGLFDAFKGLVNKIKGSITKLTDWASKKLRKLVKGAVKLVSKVMRSNPVLNNANAILDMAKVSATMLSEEVLVEKDKVPITFKPGKTRANMIDAWETLRKQLKSGMVNKEYAKIQVLVNALNAHKAKKFKTSNKDAVILKTTVEAGKIKESHFASLCDKVIEKLGKEKDWEEGDADLTTEDFFLPLKVASHYTAYNAINVILKNLLKNIGEQQHVVDAAKTFVADVKSEAKFGNTRLPLWIVYGHGGKAHYLETQAIFHEKSAAAVASVEEDQPYIVIQITPSKVTASTYNLGGHNVTQVYLMSGLASKKEKEKEKTTFKTKYLVLNFTTSSGSKFTMKAEVEKEVIKKW